jgi:hypothetical protein
MACGSCGGKARANTEYVVALNGVDQPTRFASMGEGRIWVAHNPEAVKGQRVTFRAVAKTV